MASRGRHTRPRRQVGQLRRDDVNPLVVRIRLRRKRERAAIDDSRIQNNHVSRYRVGEGRSELGHIMRRPGCAASWLLPRCIQIDFRQLCQRFARLGGAVEGKGSEYQQEARQSRADPDAPARDECSLFIFSFNLHGLLLEIRGESPGAMHLTPGAVRVGGASLAGVSYQGRPIHVAVFNE